MFILSLKKKVKNQITFLSSSVNHHLPRVLWTRDLVLSLPINYGIPINWHHFTISLRISYNTNSEADDLNAMSEMPKQNQDNKWRATVWKMQCYCEDYRKIYHISKTQKYVMYTLLQINRSQHIFIWYLFENGWPFKEPALKWVLFTNKVMVILN